MKVSLARNHAIEWVTNYASLKEGFRGAYFSGSTIELSQDTVLPSTSDIDIVIVTASDSPPLKLGKFLYKNTLLEVTYLSWDQLQIPEEVLTSYHLAGSFRVDTIISDPTGHLRRLQNYISTNFANITWVRKRCNNVFQKIKNGIISIDTTAPFHNLVTSWLFPTGITTHAVLVAALRNPTVRKRYTAAREVLVEYKQEEIYEEFLQLIGCQHMTAHNIENYLNELTKIFDVASAIAKTPFFFSSDITRISRPIAIDGSRELIRSGYHHEAVFWIVATFARCHMILEADAPQDLQDKYLPAFEALIRDLGIHSRNDFVIRGEAVIQFLPRLIEITEVIMLANKEIHD